MKTQIKPGTFGIGVAADAYRRGFDLLNAQVLYNEKRPDILFVGDSITNWWDLSLYFGDLGLYIANRGIGGDSTGYILKRSDADVFQLEPKSIVYMAGINDLLGLTPNLWDRQPGADRAELIKSVVSNIEAFVKKCDGIKLYLCSILPVDMCLPYSLANIEDAVVEVNEQLKSICQKYGATYVDYHSALKNEHDNKLREGLSSDGIHPEGEAYAIMTQILRGAMQK